MRQTRAARTLNGPERADGSGSFWRPLGATLAEIESPTKIRPPVWHRFVKLRLDFENYILAQRWAYDANGHTVAML